jgi:hypothetical protein
VGSTSGSQGMDPMTIKEIPTLKRGRNKRIRMFFISTKIIN